MTGLGLDLDSSWTGLIQGKSPIKKFSLFDASDLPCDFGVELPPEASELFASLIKTRNRNQMTRATMIAIATAAMAIENANLLPCGFLDRSRVGIVLGSSGSGYSAQGADSQRILKNMISSPAAWISLKWKFLGPSYVISTACSSGAYALHAAHYLITSGICDVVICGAADSSINYNDVSGFCSLFALSEDKQQFESASRPFDKNRNGFVIGEGGGMLIVESEEFARMRKARILAKLSSPGLCSEGYNILSPEPDGRGMAQAIRNALQNAGLSPSDIDYINAHGTSTDLNDRFETQAIMDVFGEAAQSIPVSSTKSMTGHCLGAAAGIEAVICCKVLMEQMIPPTANLREQDPELPLDYVPESARAKKVQHVISNSFAFGGQNGVCVISQPDN